MNFWQILFLVFAYLGIFVCGVYILTKRLK